MDLKQFLEDCKQENIIDQATEDRMYAHFLKRKEQQASRTIDQLKNNQKKQNNGLIITVSIIGVVLIGFGVIYLFAHNWDQFSRSTKTALSLTPVLISIAASIFTVVKRKDNIIWQEATAVSSFLAVGSMLGLIMQVYQLPGIEHYFVTYWCILCLPVIYILKSHIAVFCALILIFLNAFSNPMDQSAIYQVPWFGSLVMFSALFPYFKQLFTLRQPESLFQIHQIIVPLLVCLSTIISMKVGDSISWLIIYLTLANFYLFGTSIFFRNDDQTPTIMSYMSYCGLVLVAAFFLFSEKWGFQAILNHEPIEFRVYFIPILFILAVFQLFISITKEKYSFNGLNKLALLLPIPFIILDFLQVPVTHFFQLAVLLLCFVLIDQYQKRKSETQVYAVLGLFTLLLFSICFSEQGIIGFFLMSLIPSVFYLIPLPMMKEASKNDLSAVQIITFSFQLLFLIIASFEGFWNAIKLKPTMYVSDETADIFAIKPFTYIMIVLIAIALLLNAYQHRKILQSHLNGVFAYFSLFVPLLIFIAGMASFNMQHLFSLVLLAIGVFVLIFGAKRSNLTIANFALGLIGLVMFCRFFDLKMSLTVKGILFIAIGVAFFVANYIILKNRKHENS